MLKHEKPSSDFPAIAYDGALQGLPYRVDVDPE
jgi:hypothetical protein